MSASGKPALRRLLRERLASLTADAAKSSSAVIRQRIEAWNHYRPAETVALFHPTAREPDLLPLVDSSPDKRFVFPLCHPDRTLTWHAMRVPDGLHSGWRISSYGIHEPDPVLCPPVPAEEIQLVLVPGLGFTEDGHRLGHGAGYYDRFLASLAPEISTAGIGFSCQILPSLPSDPHDIPVGRVIHEQSAD